MSETTEVPLWMMLLILPILMAIAGYYWKRLEAKTEDHDLRITTIEVKIAHLELSHNDLVSGIQTLSDRMDKGFEKVNDVNHTTAIRVAELLSVPAALESLRVTLDRLRDS